MLAMKNSIEELLALNSDFLLSNADLCYAVVDGNKCPNKLPIKSKPVVRGDALVYSIALASIIAKVERDHFMVRPFNLEETPISTSTNQAHFLPQYALDSKYPEYGFAQHKGYPTKKHILALHKYGPCEAHRLTFGPCKGRVIWGLEPPQIGQDLGS
jgi:ribonuclease HII